MSARPDPDPQRGGAGAATDPAAAFHNSRRPEATVVARPPALQRRPATGARERLQRFAAEARTAVAERDWDGLITLAERMTWPALAGLTGLVVGIVFGVLGVIAVMAPAWMRQPIVSLAGTLARIPTPHLLTALVVLAGGLAAARWGGRWLLLAARAAVVIVAVAVAYRLVRG